MSPKSRDRRSPNKKISSQFDKESAAQKNLSFKYQVSQCQQMSPGKRQEGSLDTIKSELSETESRMDENNYSKPLKAKKYLITEEVTDMIVELDRRVQEKKD